MTVAGKMRKLFRNPWKVLGMTIYFVDRIPCHQCDDYEGLELCPNYDAPDDCPLQIVKQTVESVAYYRMGGRRYCNINDVYEFQMGCLDKEVFPRRFDAWRHMKYLENQKGTDEGL